MMKRILAFLLCFTIGFSAMSQIHNPIEWKTSVEKVSETNYNLVSTATIQGSWHLYAQQVPSGGPIPTTFTYDDDGGKIKIVGNTTEPEGEIKFTTLFGEEGMNIKSFAHKAVFKQEIEVVDTSVKEINAFVEFIACTDEMCLPPKEVDLKFDLTTATKASTGTTKETKTTDKVASKEIKKEEKKGLWAIFFIAFLSGFAALLTPCVFPMIPMTVSFFTKQSKSKSAGIRNAIIYGLCIVVIYVLLGSGVSFLFGADKPP